MPNNKHVFLINKKAASPKFNRQRGRNNDDDQMPEVEPQPKFIKDFQKENFRTDNINFYSQRKQRNENRSIRFSKNIDLVRIFFHTVFNSDLNKKFEQNYGLSAVEYSHFNKTVVFEVISEPLFKVFENHLKQVIESADGTPYENQPFNLIALILRFEFIGSRHRLLTFKESGILLTLISSANPISKVQKEGLITLLKEQNLIVTFNPAFPDILGIKKLQKINPSSLRIILI